MHFKLLFIVVLVGCFISSTHQQRVYDEQQRDILVEFYNATNKIGWSYNQGWLSTSNICQWYGVMCNSDGKVIQLDLKFNLLSGTIPSSLGQLNNLQDLVLPTNQLSGTIPSSLGQLSNLRNVYLYRNQLSGTIPDSIGQLYNLQHIYINSNQLSGTIPLSLGQLNNITHLFLSNNQLQYINWKFQRPVKLSDCDMSSNKFKCPIPDWTKMKCTATCA
jgi:hypothetical protein